jgi:hypothetical protein
MTSVVEFGNLCTQKKIHLKGAKALLSIDRKGVLQIKTDREQCQTPTPIPSFSSPFGIIRRADVPPLSALAAIQAPGARQKQTRVAISSGRIVV